MKVRAKTRLIAILTVIALIVPQAIVAAEVAKGKTIRLEAFEGVVSVTSGTGKKINASEKMRIFNGYNVKTDSSSYAYLSLDDKKVVKLDKNTEVNIKKSWFSNKVVVLSGTIFFNVTESLKNNETLDINTSTMSMGIRGTSGIVSVDEVGSKAQLYTGKAKIESTITGNSKEANIAAGEQAKLSNLDKELIIIKLSNDGSEIPFVALNEINNNEELKKEIENQTDLNIDNFNSQELINSEQENAEILEKSKEIENARSEALTDKKENRKKSTDNSDVTGRSSSSGSSKAQLTWEIIINWLEYNPEGSFDNFVSFLNGYSSNLNISGYNNLTSEAKEEMAYYITDNEMANIINFDTLENFTDAFNAGVMDFSLPIETPEPSATPEPSVTPDPSATSEPSVTPDPSATPELSVTPDPSATPEPSETPQPSAT